jgi:cell division protein FtsB
MFERIITTSKNILERFSGHFLIFVIFLLLLSLVKNVGRVKRITSKIQEVEIQVAQSNKEKEEIKHRLETVQGEEYVEKQLRDGLGLAKGGEIVVILPDDALLRKLVPEYPEEEEVLPDPNWKKWLKLFF